MLHLLQRIRLVTMYNLWTARGNYALPLLGRKKEDKPGKDRTRHYCVRALTFQSKHRHAYRFGDAKPHFAMPDDTKYCFVYFPFFIFGIFLRWYTMDTMCVFSHLFTDRFLQQYEFDLELAPPSHPWIPKRRALTTNGIPRSIQSPPCVRNNSPLTERFSRRQR